MARTKTSRWRLRLFGAVLLVALIAAGWGWWTVHHWRPAKSAYPVQGIEVGSEDGKVDWKAAKAIGASFAYLDASASAFARDPAFSQNLEDARAAKLQVGAVHSYDPCQPAEKQAANFMTVVARDPAMLPPALALDMLADDCPVKVTDAAVLSELMTFLNQIETHTGKATILKISRRFEKRYHLAARIDRNLWLESTYMLPEYAGRPWTLWTANAMLNSEASANALRWVVVSR
ncbi:MAG: glycoside hydrolase family 25 protein [Novosphingobium sp.]|nr:glycoside hydrolase family 25 protein [Novosphingobium sp.]